jgi:3-deoxy-manno-octulosonate cytidylyltransferase (CMP-KDO synthetase)
MATEPTIIGVIPARYDSQRLPAKPLVDLLGKSMVQRVYEQSQKARLLRRVVVATDNTLIREAVRRFGGNVIMTSADIKSGSDRVAAVASEIGGDIFVNIQGDEPLIAPEMIDQAVGLLLDDPSVPVGTLIRRIDVEEELLNPNVVKVVVNCDMRAMYFSRSIIPHVRGAAERASWLRQQVFYKHIGLYVFRREFLATYTRLPESNLEKAEKLEQLRILQAGYAIKAGITTFDSMPVDTQEDVARVLECLRRTSTASQSGS